MFFIKQKTAYEMRISDWSSDVCSSDLLIGHVLPGGPGYWAMIGMVGIMSGAMRAPMTGALFAVELTGHFDALTSALAASAAAYAVSVLIMRRSILTEKIARRGRHILQEYTVDPLNFLQAAQIGRAHV